MKTLLEFSQQPAVHALGWTLLHFLWQGTLLVVLLAGVLAMLSRKPPQLRYVSACCALALMLVLPLITWQHLVATPQIAATNVPVEAHLGPSVEPGWTGAPEPWRNRLAREVDQSVPWVLSRTSVPPRAARDTDNRAVAVRSCDRDRHACPRGRATPATTTPVTYERAMVDGGATSHQQIGVPAAQRLADGVATPSSVASALTAGVAIDGID